LGNRKTRKNSRNCWILSNWTR